MAIAMAPASTARPANWAPMSLGLSGRVAAVVTTRVAAWRWCCGPTAGPGLGLAPELGATVGNSPDGLTAGAVLDSGGSVAGGSAAGGSVVGGSVAGGSVAGGSVPLPGWLGPGAGGADAMTTTPADAWKAAAPGPLALAVRSTCLPRAAAFRTLTLACSSSDWPTGRFPRWQTDLLKSGQTVNRAESTPATWAICAVTVTFRLRLLVLHIQIA
jgi:hypothetical protein